MIGLSRWKLIYIMSSYVFVLFMIINKINKDLNLKKFKLVCDALHVANANLYLYFYRIAFYFGMILTKKCYQDREPVLY